MKDKPEYLSRLELETEELLNKIQKLKDFIHGDFFHKIVERKQQNLVTQLYYMEHYGMILVRRLIEELVELSSNAFENSVVEYSSKNITIASNNCGLIIDIPQYIQKFCSINPNRGVDGFFIFIK